MATYEWLDCDNGNTPIVGEISQSYTPTITGNYAVAVTLNGCTDTSACVLVDFTGLESLNNADFTIYPNPGNGIFNVKFSNNGDYDVDVFDVSGKLVYHINQLSSANNNLNLSNLEKGGYHVRISNGDNSVTKNLVIM